VIAAAAAFSKGLITLSRRRFRLLLPDVTQGKLQRVLLPLVLASSLLMSLDTVSKSVSGLLVLGAEADLS